MTNLKNHILKSTLEGTNKTDIPVWLMRQAGRYLPEYRELKEKYSFNQLSENPELAATVTLQPLQRYKELDAAILFADIMSPSKALGFSFEFNPGPVLENPIKSPEDIFKINIKDIKETNQYIFDALKIIRSEIPHKALLGFAASPWTLACYLIHQGIYKQHLGTKIFAAKFPEAFENLCEKITEITINYLIECSNSGADAVQIFDTWASLLSVNEYENLSGKWIKKIVTKLKEKNIPVIIYAQSDINILKIISEYQPRVLSVDWKINLLELSKIIPNDILLQGNIDPTSLFKASEDIKKLVRDTYTPFLQSGRIIANLGHGILPQTPTEAVQSLLSEIKNLS